MSGKIGSRIAWFALCLIVLSGCIPSMLHRSEPYLADGGKPAAALLKNWKVHYGDVTSEANADWLPFDESEWKKLKGYRGPMTVVRELPGLRFEQPYLFLSGMNRFEVLLDGESIYRFRMDGSAGWASNRFDVHPVKLSPGYEGRLLTIRMIWEGLPFFPAQWAIANDPYAMLRGLIQSEWPLYAISLLLATAGFIGLALFLRRKEKLYGWFAALALSSGFGMLFLCRSLQWFIEPGPLYYWNDLLLPLGMLAFVGFYGEMLKASARMPMRLAKASLLLFAVSAFAVGLFSPSGTWSLYVDVLPFVGLAAMAAVTYALFRVPVPARNTPERLWLVRGYSVLTVCGLTHVLALHPAWSTATLSESWKFIAYLLGGMLPNGLFLFVLSMVMVLVHQVRRVHAESELNERALIVKNAELEQFHRDLERLVELRTKELGEANRSLTETMREKAETLAEVSVLEERTRIAHDMHDVVGHTLTAAIVQLEATMKLADRGNEIPAGKLATVNGLIRKGLEDIRKSVRLLKSDETPLRLEAALRELIRETEETMEVAIETRIELPGGVGKLAEKVVYHALQEGLTNGIRHGRCTRFDFSLRREDGRLRFRLWNDGLPFGSSKPGFGLTAMTERIHLLGGRVEIGAPKTEGVSAAGCELLIEIPLRAPSAVAG